MDWLPDVDNEKHSADTRNQALILGPPWDASVPTIALWVPAKDYTPKIHVTYHVQQARSYRFELSRLIFARKKIEQKSTIFLSQLTVEEHR